MDEHPSDWRWEAIAETPTASPMISILDMTEKAAKKAAKKKRHAERFGFARAADTETDPR